MSIKKTSNSRTQTNLAKLKVDVRNQLAEFDKQQSEQAALLNDALCENRAERTVQVKELLDLFAEQRAATRNALRDDLAVNQSSRTVAVAQLLSEFSNNHQDRTQALFQRLSTEHETLINEVAGMLATFQVERKARADQLRRELGEATELRRREVANFLIKTAANRRASSNVQPYSLPVPVDIPEASTALTQTNLTVNINPVTTSGPELIVQNVIRSEQLTGPIKTDELFLYLIGTSEAPTLAVLEEYFGAERLNTYWEEFVNLYEELRPDSQARLRALTTPKKGKPLSKLETTATLKLQDIFAYLALHPDGLPVEELEKHFSINRTSLNNQLKKLIETGIATKKDELYQAI